MTKNTKNKKTKMLALILPALLIISLFTLSAGCEIPFLSEIAGNGNNNNNDYENEDLIPEVNEIPAEDKTLNVQIYLGDEKAIKEDERGEYGYVTPVHRTILFMEEENIVLKTTLEELISGPRPNEMNLSGTLPATVKVTGVIIDEEGTATIDLSQEAVTDSPGGALGGTIFRESIVYTATQFPSIDKVLVTVDGSPYSDGHIIWSDPLSRGSLY